MVDRFLIYMATRQGLGTSGVGREVLDTLSASRHFAPTHWSATDGGSAQAFAPDAVLAAFGKGKEGASQLELFRRKDPKYRCHLANRLGELSHLELELSDMVDAEVGEAIFALGDDLAAVLKPEYGFVHAWRKGSDRTTYQLSGYMTFFNLQMTGPRPVAARTWIGKHISSLDVAGFLIEEVPSKKTGWGGLKIELASSPWQSDESELEASQTRIMEALGPTGVWGDYRSVLPKPGPNWRPVGASVI